MYIRKPPSLPAAGGTGQQRRAGPRHLPVERRAWLTWETDGSARRIAARLLDISRGGAAVEVDADVPRDRRLQFSLPGSPANMDSLEATVAGATKAHSGSQRIHLAFTTECPDQLLKAALFGHRRAAHRPPLAELAAKILSFAAPGNRTPNKGSDPIT